MSSMEWQANQNIPSDLDPDYTFFTKGTVYRFDLDEDEFSSDHPWKCTDDTGSLHWASYHWLLAYFTRIEA